MTTNGEPAKTQAIKGRLVLKRRARERIERERIQELELGYNRSFGFIKMSRSEEVMELIEANPLAFALAAVISQRARWTSGYHRHQLALGEAFLGDYAKCGMTRQQFRTALSLLVKAGFATTRATNKGTIAKLVDTRIFDPLAGVSNQLLNQQATNSQPPANQQLTTNEEYKKERREESKKEEKKPLRPDGPECAPPDGRGVFSHASEKSFFSKPTTSELRKSVDGFREPLSGLFSGFVDYGNRHSWGWLDWVPVFEKYANQMSAFVASHGCNPPPTWEPNLYA